MRKALVGFGICLIAASLILAFSIAENRLEEAVIDKWDPITPSKLDPKRVTGWAFTALTPNGRFLELNISSSGNITIIIGESIFYDKVSGEITEWNNVIFNQTGTKFTEKVEIMDKNVDFLQIKNVGTTSVDISGNIKKLDNVSQVHYPYLGLGTLIVLIGLTILFFGVSAKPRKAHKYIARLRCPR